MPPASSDEPRRRRLPSLGTLVTIAFVVLWVTRIFDGFDIGTASPTARPGAGTGASRTPVPNTIGAVTFGTSIGDECALESTTTAFSAGVDVWWRADLPQAQSADAAIVVVTMKGSQQIDYEYVPPDPAVGRWQVFCSGPARDDLAGTYRIELWNADRSKLLARGEFMRLGPSATPAATGTPRPSRTPEPTGSPEPSREPSGTFVVALAGEVGFGTALDSDCRLHGAADTFEQHDLVWWRAELNQAVPRDASVRLFVLRNGFITANELIPAGSLVDGRTVACAWAPTEGVATGYYVVQVWTSDRQIMLANGVFFRKP